MLVSTDLAHRFRRPWRALLGLLVVASGATASAQQVHFVSQFESIQDYIDDGLMGDTVPGVDVQDGDILQLFNGLHFVPLGGLDFRGRALTVRGGKQLQLDGSYIWQAALYGSNGEHVVKFVSGETNASVLEDVLIRGGVAENVTPDEAFHGGGVLVWNSSPSIVGCQFIENRALRGGGLAAVNEVDGGVSLGTGEPLRIVDCVFDECFAEIGGAVYLENMDTEIVNCEFVGNQAGMGGAIFEQPCDFADSVVFTPCAGTGSSLSVQFSRFENNGWKQLVGTEGSWWETAQWLGGLGGILYSGYSGNIMALPKLFIHLKDGVPTPSQYGSFTFTQGGAIYSRRSDGLQIVGCEFEWNRAYWGGALYSYGSTAEIESTTFRYSAHFGLGIEPDDSQGGAIFNFAGDVGLEDCEFERSTAYTGGAIANYSSVDDGDPETTFEPGPSGVGLATLTASGTLFSANNARDGGAIANDGGLVDLANCDFAGNRAADTAGAPVNKYLDVVPRTDQFLGGALYSVAGQVNCERTDFVENVANRGGALYLQWSPAGPGGVERCRFDDNGANEGSAVFLYEDSPTISNSLFRGNFALPELQWGSPGSPDTLDHGVVQDATGGHPALVNCTIAFNGGLGVDSLLMNGGGPLVLWFVFPRTQAVVLSNGGVLENSIVWGNESKTTSSAQVVGPALTAQFSIVEDGFAGQPVITSTPNFFDAPAVLWLKEGPGVDQGSNALVVSAQDLSGNARILNPGFNGDCAVNPGACGVTSPPTVDMGAYELGAVHGSCPTVHPLLGGVSHTCQDHNSHNHSGENLAGIDLTWSDLDNADFSGADLTDAKLTDVSMQGDGTRLNGAILVDADFSRAQMQGCDFTGADVTGTNFSGVQFLGAQEWDDFNCNCGKPAKGLEATTGAAYYDIETNFAGTGFDPVAAGWIGIGVPEPVFQVLPETLNVQTGGSVNFHLAAGPEHAGDLYFVVGSEGYGQPGLPLDAWVLNLNIFSWYFAYTVNHANGTFLQDTLGFLDDEGRATASLTLPGIPAIQQLWGPGSRLYHAAVLVDLSSSATSLVTQSLITDIVWYTHQ